MVLGPSLALQGAALNCSGPPANQTEPRNQLLVSSDALKAQLETSEQGLRESLQQLKAFLDELQETSHPHKRWCCLSKMIQRTPMLSQPSSFST